MTKRSYTDAAGDVLQRLIAPLRRGAPSHRFPMARPYRDGFLDFIEVESAGLLRLIGWTPGDPAAFASSLTVRANDEELQPMAAYRLHRPDLKEQGLLDPFLGFGVDYLLRPRKPMNLTRLTLASGGTPLFEFHPDRALAVPAYDGLFDESKVLQREQIYGYGPPSREVSAEVLAFAGRVTGPVLDYGCGAGALLMALRARGLDAQGLELDRPEIAAGLIEDARPHVKLYSGALPAPYPDKSFTSVTCVEVLEHVPDYRAAVADIARIAQRTCLFTVPDISAIPLLHEHHVVPWHLLESTHFNFFTQNSLGELLRTHFRRVDIARLGPVQINGTTFFTSLGAVCEVEA